MCKKKGEKKVNMTWLQISLGGTLESTSRKSDQTAAPITRTNKTHMFFLARAIRKLHRAIYKDSDLVSHNYAGYFYWCL